MSDQIKNFSTNRWLTAGALMGFFSVALGAFGAHSLADILGPASMKTWHTSSRYLMYHALALCFVSVLISFRPNSKSLLWSARCFFLGNLVFSGSLYILAYTGIKVLGAITPIGGTIQLIGWLLLAYTGWKRL